MRRVEVEAAVPRIALCISESRQHLNGSHCLCSADSLTVQQDDGLLERQGVPDLQLAVRTLQDANRKKEHKGRCFLDALEHALLREIVGAVVVLRRNMQTRGEGKGTRSQENQ